MKRQFTYILGITLSLIAGTAAYAASSPEQSAKKLADSYAPEGMTYLRTELDDGLYEVFYSGDKETFEYKVNGAGTSIVSFDSERFYDRGGSSVTVTEETAKRKVTDEITDAKIVSVYLDREDDIEYEIRFQTDSYYGEYTIHPENGAILQRDIKIGSREDAVDGTSAATSKSQTTSFADIGAEKAKQIALKEVPGASIASCDRDYEHGKLVYELELYNGRWEYDIDIDGATGTVIKMEKDYDD